jgi:chemotaxis protein CheX
MDVSYVNPFITATVETFQTMIQMEVKPGKPAIKKGKEPTYDISGVIGLSGEAQGSIAISFPKLIALKVVSTMLGMTIKTVDADVTDAIGEVANIIAGNAKKELSQYKLTISLPNVIVGKSHSISAPSGTPTIIVPIIGQVGEFAMEVALKTR